MRASIRLDLISKIGRELQSRYTFQELYSYLAAFSIPFTENGATDSKWKYARAALDNESDATIIEIAIDLGIQVPIEVNEPETPALPKIWEATTEFRLFISHLAKNKDKATRLKEELSQYVISGFVAHEDINPTDVWQSEIERGLNTMDAMVAIHTSGFSESIWTQQEIGFALGKQKKIISLRMGEDPKGFISKHQALPRHGRNASEIAALINNLLFDDPRTKGRLDDAQKNDPLFGVEYVEMPPEVSELLRLQKQIDLEAAGPKAPVSGYVYRGIQIESRWSVARELEVMRRVISILADPLKNRIQKIWCDSKAGAVYSVHMAGANLDVYFKDQISEAFVRAGGGYNGIFFEIEGNTSAQDEDCYLDPWWPEADC